ncbi:ABC transporter substrate-binding protein [Nocardia stercoris]|uniref:ABC transporter substrate-binding protein n=1 Tax=Nocardia stercoris TaxID=2483361 RepID=UPI00131A31AB|nr:ABC transporter substrate-binding protein [Nocardia stercoris]
MFRPALRFAACVAIVAAALSGCSSGSGAAAGNRLRLGYFPNLTHATALLGVANGTFGRALGPGVELRTSQFTSGPPAVTALLSDAVDAVFIGATPAVNAYLKTKGNAVIVAGATSGGAELVVRAGIDTPQQLRGRTVADPALGGAQDVSLRYWLQQQGFQVGTAGDGDVHVAPQDNAQIAAAFAAGAIDGAWVPQPYAAQLVGKGAHVLVDERELWPQGRFATTELVVRSSYLKAHRETVVALLRGLVQQTSQVGVDPDAARAQANTVIAGINGTRLADADLAGAWSQLTFTVDPLLSTVREYARRGATVGVLPAGDLTGLADLGPLNDALRAEGRPAVAE